MAAYTVGHHGVVLFARAVNAGGAQHDVVQSVNLRELLLGFEFGTPVGGIGLRRVGGADGTAAVFAKRAAHAEAADKNEAACECAGCKERLRKERGALSVDFEEIGLAAAFCGTGGVDNVMPCPVRRHVRGECLHHLFLRTEVNLYEMDARVGEIAAAARRAHGRPHVHAFCQGALYKETSDKAAGAGDEYLANRLHC